jgi:UDP-N-acetyl-D-mannosaminuronic acid dehydrogenase
MGQLNMSSNAKVTVIGAGYVGLPTGLLFSNAGLETSVVEIDAEKVSQLQSGDFKIEESKLQELYENSRKAGNIIFSNTIQPADVYIICVPTPIGDDLKPDMKSVWSVMNELVTILEDGDLVILESTSPPGSVDELELILSRSGNQSLVDFAYCPERVLPGDSLREIRENDRVVGGNTPSAAERAKDLYEIITVGHVFTSNTRTAEIAKLAENAFRAVNIGFANELAMLCLRNGVDVRNVIQIANRHPRVEILAPGIGVGGHCIPVDPLFLYPNGVDIENSVIFASNRFNASVPNSVAEKILDVLRGVSSPVVIEGLGYKPDSSDTRNSPAVQILEILSCTRTDLSFLVLDPSIQKWPDWIPKPNNVQLTNSVANSNGAIRVRLVKNSQFTWKPDYDFSSGVLHEEN